MRNDSVTAIVLAGDRDANDPLLAQENVKTKALIDIHGRPMVSYVLDALKSCTSINKIIVVGGADISSFCDNETILYVPQEDGPSASVLKAMDKRIQNGDDVLVTTADHPLLTSDNITRFLDKSIKSLFDFNVAFVRTGKITKSYPCNKRTKLPFRDGSFTGCNLFSFRCEYGRTVLTYWQGMERLRKKPFHIAAKIGWITLLRLVMRRLRLQDVLDTIGRKCGVKIGAVILSDPTLGIDVDKPDDLKLAKEILKDRK